MIKRIQLFFSLAAVFALGTYPFEKAYGQFNQVPDEVEYQALVDLFNSTNGSGWANKTNWLNGQSNASFTNWYGVTVTDGDVTRVSLSNNNLIGKIPESIGDLSSLQVLDLRENNFNGSEIPEGIGNLVKLTNFLAKHCELRGSIPESVGNLESLRVLNLSLNYLEGDIPASIGNVVNLIDLRLDHNRLTSIPESFSNLANIETVYLNNNRLAGPLPFNIGNLRKVRYFNVSANFLSESIPASISNMTEVNNLLLNNNRFSGIIPPLPDTKGVLNINLSNNELEGNIPDQICQLQNIRTLNLGLNNLKGVIPECIGNMQGLSYLYLNSNKLTGVIPESLASIPALRHLKLSDNMLSGEIPEKLFFKSIYQITLHNNQLSGRIPEFGSVSIEYLFLNNNNFTGPIPASITNLKHLVNLRLNSNRFTALPSFLDHPLKNGLEIKIENNQLNMTSIVNNFNTPGQHPYKMFNYVPQSTPAISDTIQAATGQGFSFSANETAEENQYQWQKLAGSTWTNLPTFTSKSYLVNAASGGDAGVYRCKITNAWLPALTIYSQQFVVEMNSEFWSIADGNWTNGSAWSFSKGGPPAGTYPINHNKVFIVGNNITLTDSLSCGPIEVVVENREASLTVDGAEIIVHGEVRLSKTTEGFPGNIRVINGGKIKPVNP